MCYTYHTHPLVTSAAARLNVGRIETAVRAVLHLHGTVRIEEHRVAEEISATKR